MFDLLCYYWVSTVQCNDLSTECNVSSPEQLYCFLMLVVSKIMFQRGICASDIYQIGGNCDCDDDDEMLGCTFYKWPPCHRGHSWSTFKMYFLILFLTQNLPLIMAMMMKW